MLILAPRLRLIQASGNEEWVASSWLRGSPHGAWHPKPDRFPGVYAFADDQAVLYVGRSTNVRRRVGPDHAKLQAWSQRYNRLDLRLYVCYTDAFVSLEAHLIATLTPRLNVNQIAAVACPTCRRPYPVRRP